MKKGYKTTEFYLSLFTIIGSIAAAVSDLLPDKWAAIAITISTGAYAVSRGLTKGKSIKK